MLGPLPLDHVPVFERDTMDLIVEAQGLPIVSDRQIQADGALQLILLAADAL